jgi:hypothetical protein
MKLPNYLIGTALLTFFIASPASADLLVTGYKKLKAIGPLSDSTKLYITGVGDGYVGANIELEARGLPKLYCQASIRLNGDNYVSMIDSEIERYEKGAGSYPPGIDIGLVLLESLKHTFPCKK